MVDVLVFVAQAVKQSSQLNRIFSFWEIEKEQGMSA